MPAVDEGHLHDHCGDLRIGCSHRQHVAAAERGAPQGNPLRVDIVTTAQVSHRRPVAILLFGDVDDLARFACARPEMPIVECQHRQARHRELVRIAGQAETLGATASVPHHHTGQPTVGSWGSVEIGRTPHTVGLEEHFLTYWHVRPVGAATSWPQGTSVPLLLPATRMA